MTARGEFMRAVRECERGSLFTEDQFRAIFRGADKFAATAAREALLALAAELEAESLALPKNELPSEHIAEAAFWGAAQLARQRAREAAGGTRGSGLVSSASPQGAASVLGDPGDARGAP